jgi:putative flippase GtrA
MGMRGKRFWTRWLSFNGVGAMGVAVQLTTLTALVKLAGMHYLGATAIAVELAVLHNFAWHQHWTWSDRPSGSARATMLRLARFHMLNGAVSMVGNLGVMTILAGTLRIDPIAANVAAIATCSVVNFLASEVLVFRTAPVIAAALTVSTGVLAVPSSSAAADYMAELTSAAIAAWQQYERQVDDRYNSAAPTGEPYFAQDAFKKAGWRQEVIGGQVSMLRVESPSPNLSASSIPDAKVHHWIGAVFVPNVAIDTVIKHLRDRAGRESEAFDDVTASKLLSRDGDRIRVYMKIRRDSIITVSYNTEHTVDYRTLGTSRASSRSVATKIAELADAGTASERERPMGSDHGFLWRLNAYWRFEQTDRGVLVECESVSLSRSVPTLLRPFVNGTVERIARESLQKTLTNLRADLTKSLSGKRQASRP